MYFIVRSLSLAHNSKSLEVSSVPLSTLMVIGLPGKLLCTAPVVKQHCSITLRTLKKSITIGFVHHTLTRSKNCEPYTLKRKKYVWLRRHPIWLASLSRPTLCVSRQVWSLQQRIVLCSCHYIYYFQSVPFPTSSFDPAFSTEREIISFFYSNHTNNQLTNSVVHTVILCC